MQNPELPSFVNAFTSDDERSVVALYRGPNGRLLKREFPAEYCSFHDASEITPDVRRALRSSRFVRGVRDEGRYVRVVWANRRVREDALHGEESPFRKAAIAHYEGDIDPVTRWLVDASVTIARPKRCYLDIETDSRVPFSERRKMRVLCWSLADDSGAVFTRGRLEEDTNEDERRILDLFWRELEPYDQVVCWNGSYGKTRAFDFDVVLLRSEQRGCKFDRRRWLWVDQLPVYSAMNQHAAESGDEKASMRLGDIAQGLLGEGKEEIPDFVRARWPDRCSRGLGALAWDLWEAGSEFRELLFRYNERDTALLPRIERKTGFLELHSTIAERCGLFPDMRLVRAGRRVDGLMLRLGAAEGRRFPSKAPQREEEEGHEEEKLEKFAGAIVGEPKTLDPEWRNARGMRTGILRDVHVFDFSGMYPSIMLSWNMGAETRAPVPVNGPIPEGFTRSPLTGIGFRLDEEAIVVRALRILMRERATWNDKKKQFPPGTEEWQAAGRMSDALKIVINAFYGDLGNQYSRFADRAVAESVTQNGVWLITRTMEEVEKRGWEHIYHDSVTADRVLVTKDPWGRVQLLKVEDLWSRGIPIGSRRGKEFVDMPGWRALTEQGWCLIRKAIRHASGKPTWRITTKHGQTHVTVDHGIMCDGLETTPETFVRERRVFTTVAAPPEAPREVIDLFEYVESVNYQKGRSSCRFVVEGEWIFFRGWGKYGVKIRRFYARGSEEWRSLLRLVAAYVSDGSASIAGVTASKSALSFCKADLPLQQQIASDLLNVAPEISVYGPYWTDTVYVVRSHAVAMPLLFDALCGRKSKGKRFPDFVYELDEEGFDVLLGGLEKGDGGTSPSGGFIFTTTSQELAAGVSYLMSQHGMKHGFVFRESQGAWHLWTRKKKERPSRYRVKAETFDPVPGEYVYDLEVEGAHTFVDGIGRVLLHNTDGAYVVGPKTREEAAAFKKYLNDVVIPEAVKSAGCRECAVKIDYEKHIDRVVFTKKKRYIAAYLWYKGKDATADSKPEIKGIEYKRGDQSRIARQLQTVVIDMLVGGLREAEGPVPTEELERYHAVVAEARRHVLEDPLPIEDVRIAKGLSRPIKEYVTKAKKGGGMTEPPAQVRVAKELKKRGRQVGVGMKVEYVVVDATTSPATVIPAEDYDGTVDRFHTWEDVVWKPTERLLAAAFPEHDWTSWGRVRPPKVRGRSARVPEGQLALGELPLADPGETAGLAPRRRGGSARASHGPLFDAGMRPGLSTLVEASRGKVVSEAEAEEQRRRFTSEDIEAERAGLRSKIDFRLEDPERPLP